MSVTVADTEARRRQSGAFLRSRRERLTPSDVGLPEGFRRRTPGLRREEVALLAGVGATWYTWLEQGRDVRPSPEVLSALAAALRLDPAERQHLYILNDRPPPEPRPIGPERVDEPLRRMLDSLTRQPAYVLGRRWDILAWNRAAAILFGDYEKLVGDERNIMHLVFADKAHRKLLTDWDDLAPTVLAMFRADSARYVGDPEFERLIAKLTKVSTEFRHWWSRQDVLRSLTGLKRIKHPKAGRMTFEYTSLAVTDQVGLKLTVYTPLTSDQTAEKLNSLLSAEGP
ncbi:transcriptional regulator [Labrys miyagiensis]|uniref:Transcriptional regulator n=1 Tax=Labrys miyagiensis TaxID=346912 RepID=A0ABQ6CPJ4_9HYPH|nr:helix-turn-helix transcriptional regulator [Labrys miyagiensis]GLS22261.1 transcriptional regulator [Labrys miyagiensis]